MFVSDNDAEHLSFILPFTFNKMNNAVCFYTSGFGCTFDILDTFVMSFDNNGWLHNQYSGEWHHMNNVRVFFSTASYQNWICYHHEEKCALKH